MKQETLGEKSGFNEPRKCNASSTAAFMEVYQVCDIRKRIHVAIKVSMQPLHFRLFHYVAPKQITWDQPDVFAPYPFYLHCHCVKGESKITPTAHADKGETANMPFVIPFA